MCTTFADLVIQYLKANNNFGLQVEISREELLLDTGGGLKKASWFFLQDPNRLDEPFILHNVDVVSAIDFHRLLNNHTRIAPSQPSPSRNERARATCCLTNSANCAADKSAATRNRNLCAPPQICKALAFSGIHMISSPRLLPMMTEEGVFSVIATYLRLAGQGEKILAFRADEYYWRDLGKPR